MNVMIAIVVIAALLVLPPVFAVLFVAVAIDIYTFVREWLAGRRSWL